jgi:NDP-sugar pyrophosphorylase family protein
MKPTTSPTLLVLAAGMGSRYGGIKQIEVVGPSGETIIDYSIYDALHAGFSRVVFVIRNEIERQFKEAVGARLERHVAVDYVFQELDRLPPGFSIPADRTKPWGTVHAILTASDAIKGNFAVINADDFYGADSYRVLSEHLQGDSADYAMVGFVLRNTLSDFGAVSRGVCQVDRNGFLRSVVELTNIEREGGHARDTDASGRVMRLSGDEVVSMNMWGFTPRIFGQLEEYFLKFLELNSSDSRAESYLPSVVNELVSGGSERVRVLRTKDSWIGVTHRKDHLAVVDAIRQYVQEGRYPRRLWP